MTDELLKYWSRDEREGKTRLFFCQREAAETIIFLKEARAQEMNTVGDTSARVVKRGVPKTVLVTKTVNGEKKDEAQVKYFESDTALPVATPMRAGGRKRASQVAL